jgi:hypothetical protein
MNNAMVIKISAKSTRKVLTPIIILNILAGGVKIVSKPFYETFGKMRTPHF